MPSERKPTVGLIINSGPYQQRSARSQLDVALVAAVLEHPLRLYFLGQSTLQLLGGREPDEAQLPAGYRAWASLAGLTEVSAFAEPAWLERLAVPGELPVLEPAPLTLAQMRRDWTSCYKVLVL